MRILAIRNASFEGPELIEEWAASRGHALLEMRAPSEAYPTAADVDLLVIMGGPMDADDHAASPWLVAEKAFVREVLDAGVRVLGVCLGAQILAEVAGGHVKRNAEREIGWFPVQLTDAGRRDPLFAAFPDGAVVGHWHGDTFDLPPGAEALLSSDACVNQAFALAGGRAVGLQFHIEWTEASLAELVAECNAELTRGGAHVMSMGDILAGAPVRVHECRAILHALLDRFANGG